MQPQDAVRDYIVEQFMYDSPDAALEDDQPLIEEGIIDSLGIFTLIAFIEERFGVKVQPDDVVLENFESVNTISRLVEARRSAESESRV